MKLKNRIRHAHPQQRVFRSSRFDVTTTANTTTNVGEHTNPQLAAVPVTRYSAERPHSSYLIYLTGKMPGKDKRPTPSSIQWVSGALSSGVKQSGREAESSSPSSDEVKNGWTSFPTYTHCSTLRQFYLLMTRSTIGMTKWRPTGRTWPVLIPLPARKNFSKTMHKGQKLQFVNKNVR